MPFLGSKFHQKNVANIFNYTCQDSNNTGFILVFNWFIQYLPLGRVGRIGTVSLEKEGLIPRFEGHQKDCLAEITLATLRLVQNNPKRFSWLMFVFIFCVWGFCYRCTTSRLVKQNPMEHFVDITVFYIHPYPEMCYQSEFLCNAAWRFCCACRCRCRIFDAFQCR